MTQPPRPGTIGWLDLTVADADDLRDFYAAVVGWEPEGLDMGGYADYVMKAPGGAPVAGVCFARGANERQPPGWVPYFVVEDLAASLARSLELGAELLSDRRNAQGKGFCAIRDPSGAVCALYQA
jgi:hypothetical protein